MKTNTRLLIAFMCFIVMAMTGSAAYLAYEPNYYDAYIANSGGDTVSVVAVTSNEVVKTIPLTAGEAVDGKYTPIEVVATPDGKKVYVANNQIGIVSVIDTATNSIIDPTTDDGGKGIRLSDLVDTIAISPDGSKLYALTVDRYIAIIDTSTDTVVGSINLRDTSGIYESDTLRNIAVSKDGTKLYIACNPSDLDAAEGRVLILDLESKTVTGSFEVGSFPNDIIATPDGNKVYVVGSYGSDEHSNVICVANTANNEVSWIPDLTGVLHIAINSDGTKLYATGEDIDHSSHVYTIDTATDSMTANRDVAYVGDALAVTPDGTKLCIISGESVAEFHTLDLQADPENAESTPIAVGNGAQSIVVVDVPEVADTPEPVDIPALKNKVKKQMALFTDTDPLKDYDQTYVYFWLSFASKAHQDEYDTYINNVYTYRGLQYSMLRDALKQANAGNEEKMNRDLGLASTYGQKASDSFSNACGLFDHIAKHQYFVAKEVQSASVEAFKIVGTAAGAPPGSLEGLDLIVIAWDDAKIEGKSTTETKLDIVLHVAGDDMKDYMLNEVTTLPGMNGATISETFTSNDFWRGKTATDAYKTLSGALGSDEAATALFLEVQKEYPDITLDAATALWELITMEMDEKITSAIEYQEAKLNSPGELRVYDSQGRVTGLVDGVVVEDIPNSIYDAENESVIIFGSTDTYTYNVVGTDTGEYGLDLLAANNTACNPIHLRTNITPNAVHQYTVDWDNIDEDKAITLETDSNGDGTFDETVKLSLPTASFTNTQIADRQISFNGSASTGDNIVSYTWDFGDGNSGDGQTVDHTYANTGYYDATLKVRDNNGGIDNVTRNVVVTGTPTITWDNPADITYGTVLSDIQLNAVASANGTFTYAPAAGTTLDVGTQTLHADFTPEDATIYNTTSADVTINVVKATPAITWSNPANITAGAALDGTQLNATASVDGAFNYTPAAGTILAIGTHTLHTDFTPTDVANYNTATADVTINVVAMTPVQKLANLKLAVQALGDAGKFNQQNLAKMAAVDKIEQRFKIRYDSGKLSARNYNVLIAKLEIAKKKLLNDKTNTGNCNALLVKLNAAEKNLNAGNTNAAGNNLNAFNKQVNSFIRTGRLSSADGKALINAANDVINVLKTK